MIVDWSSYRAVLFDLDGVITPTAEVHMRAWAQMFNDFLRGRGVEEPYTDADYFEHVDGKPRYDGVRDFLASRDIVLPDGTPEDPADQAAGAETVCGLGNRKNDAFGQVLRDEGVAAYPGSLRLLEELRERGTALAIVSSSKNAPDVLAAAGVTDFFTVVVHGGVAAERGLRGKPAPDTYQEAARELGVPDESAVVVEDATSGVAAGAAGTFGLVVGVDRGVGHDALTRAGADVVVDDLDELTTAAATPGEEQR
ncbi:HAD family hydrolase [Nocardioides dongxiaopingii]|uniref:HAD family hydrolase n=1 Tax=Nocardioides dongxiaopingii TaxID=2576036 RepID=UPI0010C7705F|nr:beta-phosphoglucomutase family hydrolase [Nocardioides dongxiaopingii]